MNLIDSCGWLEYFAEGHNAEFFAPAIETPETQIVPVVTLYEVFKRILQQRGEAEALRAIALMRQGRVVDLDETTALDAARLSLEIQLPMADGLILATARQFRAIVWTQDAHFAAIQGVRYISAKVVL